MIVKDMMKNLLRVFPYLNLGLGWTKLLREDKPSGHFFG